MAEEKAGMEEERVDTEEEELPDPPPERTWFTGEVKQPTLKKGKLTIYYPLPNPFIYCPAPNCRKQYQSVKYMRTSIASNVGLLLEHFKTDHAEIKAAEEHHCLECKQEIIAKSKLGHRCLKKLAVQSTEKPEWLCVEPGCGKQFMTKYALSAHEGHHKRSRGTVDPVPSTPSTSQSSTPMTSQSSTPSTSNSLTASRKNTTHGKKRDAEGNKKEPLVNADCKLVVSDQPDATLDQEDKEYEEMDTTEQPEEEVDHMDSSNNDAPADLEQKVETWATSLYEIKNLKCSDDRWILFEKRVAAITAAIQQELQIDTTWRETQEYGKIDTSNQANLRRLYDCNPKRAMRAIRKEAPLVCNAEVDEIQNHFKEKMKLEADPLDETFFEQQSDEKLQEMKKPYFTSQEILKRLAQFRNTAPGPDKLQYRHWKMVDTEGKLLETIFFICIKYCKVPSAWKQSKTFLFAKKENPFSLNDWRPISLLPTIYKLYTALLSQKVKDWCSSNNVIHPSQKGGSEHDVILEHSFIIDVLIQKAKSSKKHKICFAFLDVKQAFPSVPVKAVLTALATCGAGKKIIQLVSNLLADRTTQLIGGKGTTPAILIDRGLLMGDPISSVLFNLVLNHTILSVNQLSPLDNTIPYSVLADIDDLCVFSRTQEELQEKVNVISSSLKKIGLELNSEKCVALEVCGRSTVDIAIYVNSKRIPHLQKQEHHLYLGVKIGYKPAEEETPIAKYMDDVRVIMRSRLSGWQKIDALRQFVMPLIHQQLRIGRGGIEEWRLLDEAIRSYLKIAMGLPPYAPVQYVYGSRRFACLGFPNCRNDFSAMKVVNVYKLLTSKDLVIREMAEGDLRKMVRQKGLTEEGIKQAGLDYLNEKTHLASKKACNIWKVAHFAFNKLNITCTYAEDETTITVKVGNELLKFLNKSQLLRELREKKRVEASHELMDPVKYKLFGTSLHSFSVSSYSNYFFTSDCLNEMDWFFIHRARLHLTALLGNVFESANVEDMRCRKCKDPTVIENLAHVLNCCKNTKPHQTTRHNSIVKLLKDKLVANDFRVLSEDQPLSDLSSHLRPDLVVSKNRTAYVIDVTIPFDKTQYMLQEAARQKHEKYDKIAEEWKESQHPKYLKVEVVPFVVGSRGAWYLQNDDFLKRVIPRKYERIWFSRTCVRKVIRWSRCILDWFKNNLIIHVENDWPNTRTTEQLMDE